MGDEESEENESFTLKHFLYKIKEILPQLKKEKIQIDLNDMVEKYSKYLSMSQEEVSRDELISGLIKQLSEDLSKSSTVKIAG